jgi:hypothetical protein
VCCTVEGLDRASSSLVKISRDTEMVYVRTRVLCAVQEVMKLEVLQSSVICHIIL